MSNVEISFMCTLPESFLSGIKQKHAYLRVVKSGDLDYICKYHPKLEILKIYETVLSKEELDKIAANLKVLKTLRVTILECKLQDVMFLNDLSHLKHLIIKSGGPYNWLNLNVQLPNLEELRLDNFEQCDNSGGNFEGFNWFRNFKELQYVVLTDCVVNNWPNFLEQINGVGKLRFLELNNVRNREVGHAGDLMLSDTSALICLKLNRCSGIQRNEMRQLLMSCSKSVQIIYFLNMNRFADVVSEELLWKAQRIGSISLNEKPVSKNSTLQEVKIILFQKLEDMQEY